MEILDESFKTGLQGFERVTEPIVIALVTGSSLGAVWVWLRGVRRGDVVSKWNITTTYVVLIAWLLLASSVFTQFDGGNVSIVNVFGQTTILANPRAAQIMQLAGYAIIGIGFLTFFVFGIVKRNRLSTPLLLMGLLVVMTDFSSAIAGASAIGNPRIIALFALFLGASVLPRGGGARLGVAFFGFSVCVASGIFLLVNYAAAFRTCRADKCGPLGNLFFGVTTGENTIGLIVATSIPCIFLVLRGATRWILAVYLLSVVYISGSRTALQVALIVTILVLVTGMSSTSMGGIWRRFVTIGTASVGLALGIVLPYLPLNPTDFTNRAYLWKLASAQLEDSQLFGFGALIWGNQVAVGTISRDEAYSVHNQWLDIRYTTGALGIALFIILIVIALRQADKWTAPQTALLFIPVIYSGLLERTWAFGLLDVFGWMAAATLLALEPAAEPAANTSPVLTEAVAQRGHGTDRVLTGLGNTNPKGAHGN
ncbi:O-antigen ligase domain-containing protein [Cryobacterium sp. MDB1-18-2]|uniref:O-antigen ligase family protein n=1 Tax=unclassified Cryobacterium TaxID=2649013 RepID=UPI00106DB350|nr:MULTISPECIES: O-antigen ligase family protein [unclassified Cryobacterium]TFC34185.1 O-antigen ligase domain-containing protein [Cryobacterium sp. MDB1-18-2]TFC46462.1 O-antigen ligase domain-containing protein [Cryobacterium sp. MDB1-18-1]